MTARKLQSGVPTAVMAAAAILSLSCAADMAVAAVVLNAGRALPAQAAADARSLSQWLGRLTDAARQVRSRVSGHDAVAQAIYVGFGGRLFQVCEGQSLPARIFLDRAESPPDAPIRAFLTDLPPPRM